jgi:hypothetical protein
MRSSKRLDTPVIRNSIRYPDGEIIHNTNVSYCPQGSLSVTAVKPIADSGIIADSRRHFSSYLNVSIFFAIECWHAVQINHLGYDIHHIQF